MQRIRKVSVRFGPVVLALIALCGVSVLAQGAADPLTLHSFSELNTTGPGDPMVDLADRLAAAQCNLAVVPASKMSTQDALKSARSLLGAGGQGALKQLAASAVVKDAQLAQNQAAGALMTGNPGGALAALLLAHDLSPKDPDVLSQMAAILNGFHHPAESLALLDAADALKVPYASPMGVSGQAVALNNRGHALLLEHRLPEAQKVLERALKLEPTLAEANSNLGAVLTCDGKKEQALKFFAFAANRSGPGTRMLDICPSCPVDKKTFQRPASELLNSSAGREVPMWLPPIPQTPQASQRLLGYFRNLNTTYALAQTQRYNQRYNAALAQQGEWMKRRQAQHLPYLISLRRFTTILGAIAHVDQEPDLKPLLATKERARMDMQDFLNQWCVAECANGTMLTCSKWLAAYPDFVRKITTYEQADATWRRASSKRETGYAANLKLPFFHEDALATIDERSATESAALIQAITYWSGHGMGLREDATGPCADPSGDSTPPQEPQDARADVPACPPFVDGLDGVKVSLDLLVASFSVSCESISLEGGPKGPVALFAGVGYQFGKPGQLGQYGAKFDGKLTLTAGVKAGYKTGSSDLSAGVSAKWGAYVTFDGMGDVTDVGEKGSVSAGVKIGGTTIGTSGPSLKYSMASTFLGNP